MSFRSKPRSRLPYDGDPDTTAPRSLDRRSRNRDFANQVFGLPEFRDEIIRWIIAFLYAINPQPHESLARDDSRGKNYFRQLRGFAEKVRIWFLRLRNSHWRHEVSQTKTQITAFPARLRWIFSSKKAIVSQAKAPQYRHNRRVGEASV